MMKLPYKVSQHMEEYNKNQGAINLASLLSHAQSQLKKKKWKKWFEEVDQSCISRCLRVDKAVRDVTIHTFCDTSEKAKVS